MALSPLRKENIEDSKRSSKLGIEWSGIKRTNNKTPLVWWIILRLSSVIYCSCYELVFPKFLWSWKGNCSDDSDHNLAKIHLKNHLIVKIRLLNNSERDRRTKSILTSSRVIERLSIQYKWKNKSTSRLQSNRERTMPSNNATQLCWLFLLFD